MAGEGEESHKRIIERSPRRLATKSQFLAKKGNRAKPIEIRHTNLKFFFKDDIVYE
jgi:hypothetical protein